MWRGDLVSALKKFDRRIKFYGVKQESDNAHASVWVDLECRCPDCVIDGPVHVFSLPQDHIPISDITDEKTGRIKYRGWRSIMQVLGARQHLGKPIWGHKKVKQFFKPILQGGYKIWDTIG